MHLFYYQITTLIYAAVQSWVLHYNDGETSCAPTWKNMHPVNVFFRIESPSKTDEPLSSHSFLSDKSSLLMRVSNIFSKCFELVSHVLDIIVSSLCMHLFSGSQRRMCVINNKAPVSRGENLTLLLATPFSNKLRIQSFGLDLWRFRNFKRGITSFDDKFHW